jgi:Secretion system C-terminal sorting domain
MKQLYKIICAVWLTAFIIPPQTTIAQCSCPNGDPIDSVVHTTLVSGISDPNIIVSLPKFDPTMGTLSCVRLRTSITTILEMDLYNREPFDVPDYFMNYFRITSISGPSGGGISASQTWNKDYGPYSLTANPGLSPDSTIHIGPETVFNNLTLTRTTTNVVPYQGIGTVNFTYINSGSATMLQGSNNFRLDVQANTDVNFRLSYYWCPNAILPTGMKNFSVVRNNRQVSLKWTTENEKISNKYVIEYSRNGTSFTTLDTKNAMAVGTAQYEYLFVPPAGENGRVFFRIRQTNAQGKEFISAIKTVSFTENGTINTTLYPNPAKKQVTVQFDSPQSGSLEVSLVNTLGQIMESNMYKVSKNSSLQVNFSKTHIKGIYWMRVKNQQTGEQSVTRLTIE